MSYDPSKYGFAGSDQSQWEGTAFSQTAPPQYSAQNIPQAGLFDAHKSGNVTVNFQAGNQISMSANTQDSGGQQHTHITVQMPPQYMAAMNRLPYLRVGDKCPKCQSGTMEGKITKQGIVCSILLFPCGLIFLLTARDKVCDKCKATYDPYGRPISRK